MIATRYLSVGIFVSTTFFILACQPSKTFQPVSGPLGGAGSVVNPSCLASFKPQLELLSPGGVTVGAEALWRITMPTACGPARFILTRDGADPKTFVGRDYYTRVYAVAGDTNEKVNVAFADAVNGVPTSVDASAPIRVVDSSADLQLSCAVTQAELTVPIPVDPNNQIIASPVLRMNLTSNMPSIVQSASLNPDTSLLTVQTSLPTVAATARTIDLQINNLGLNVVTFTVANAADTTKMANCFSFITMNPVTTFPLPSVLITANGMQGTVNTTAGSVPIHWESMYADNCTITQVPIPTPPPAAITGKTGDYTASGLAVGVANVFTASCTGPGGNKSASVTVNTTCNPATNVLQNLTSRNTIALNLPRKVCQNNTCGSYPPGVPSSPDNRDVVIKTVPLLSGLKANQKVSLSSITGAIFWRVRHDGSVEGKSECPTGISTVNAQINTASHPFMPISFQFTDDAGNLIAVPGHPVADGAMLDVTELQVAGGFTVPAGATKLWDSFPDGAYWDNEFSGSDGPRVPSGNRSTGGCHYTATVLGCQ